MTRYKQGELDARYREIVNEFGLSYREDLPIGYKTYFVKFVDEHPDEFKQFFHVDFEKLLRRKLVAWGDDYGVPAVYVEAAYCAVYGGLFSKHRRKLMENFVRNMRAGGADDVAIARKLAKEFGVQLIYAKQFVRRLLGIRFNLRNLGAMLEKIKQRMAERGHPALGAVSAEYKTLVVDFYGHQTKKFWDFLEMEMDNIVRYRPKELAQIMGVQNHKWLSALFMLRHGKSWRERRKVLMRRMVKQLLSDGKPKPNIVAAVADEFGVTRATVRRIVDEMEQIHGGE